MADDRRRPSPTTSPCWSPSLAVQGLVASARLRRGTEPGRPRCWSSWPTGRASPAGRSPGEPALHVHAPGHAADRSTARGRRRPTAALDRRATSHRCCSAHDQPRRPAADDTACAAGCSTWPTRSGTTCGCGASPRRRHRGLWDQPAARSRARAPSQRALLVLHRAGGASAWSPPARCSREPPLRSDRLAELAADLLDEAEHLYDRELLHGTRRQRRAAAASCERSGVSLRRARTMRRRASGHGGRPGRARCCASSTGSPRPARTPAGRSEMLVFATSDKGGTGRSVTSSNIAYRSALQGSDVCYLDFDFGSPTAGAIFDVPDGRAPAPPRRPAQLPAGEGRRSRSRIDVWADSERARCAAGPPGAGRLVLCPGDRGGGEFARHPSVIERCADLLLRAGRGVRPVPGRPQRRPLVRHRDRAGRHRHPGPARRRGPLAGLPPVDPAARHRGGRPGLRAAGHPGDRRRATATIRKAAGHASGSCAPPCRPRLRPSSAGLTRAGSPGCDVCNRRPAGAGQPAAGRPYACCSARCRSTRCCSGGSSSSPTTTCAAQIANQRRSTPSTIWPRSIVGRHRLGAAVTDRRTAVPRRARRADGESVALSHLSVELGHLYAEDFARRLAAAAATTSHGSRRGSRPARAGLRRHGAGASPGSAPAS